MAGRAELKHAGITRVHENFALEKKGKRQELQFVRQMTTYVHVRVPPPYRRPENGLIQLTLQKFVLV
jgi:hypothetical protein